MTLRDYLIVAFLLLAVFGLGCWVGERDTKRKPLHRPYHDPRDFMARWTNYWRI